MFPPHSSVPQMETTEKVVARFGKMKLLFWFGGMEEQF
jgi:hypothetical protein